MAAAIIGGLIADGMAPADITVAEPNVERRAWLEDEFAILAAHDAGEIGGDSEVLVLAVKPEIVHSLAENLRAAFDLRGKMLMSIAAGVTLSTLERLFGDVAIVRAMPNTPVMLRLGATGLFANRQTTPAQRDLARSIAEAIGIYVEVDREDLLDAITAVSGSGPAYFFLMIEEMIRAGTALGLRPVDAAALARQTALGASRMAATDDVPPEELRRRVTSPNGTTHAAISTFREGGFGDLVSAAMAACRDRAVELGVG